MLLASPPHSFPRDVPVAVPGTELPPLEGIAVGSLGSDIQAAPRRAEEGGTAVCWDTAPSGAGDPNHGTRVALPSAELLEYILFCKEY